MFYFDNINGKKILKSNLITTNHFFTTRDTFIKTQESGYEAIAKANRAEICDYLGVSDGNLISPTQTHTSNIEIAIRNKLEYPNTDGLMLTERDLAISLNFADCTPIIFYDEKQNIGAVSHAGWRGTAGEIGKKTVEIMVSKFGSKVTDIAAAIGPAIGLCCYEVGEEVFEKLISTVKNDSNLYEKRDNKTFVDLKQINARQLEEIGVKKIDICPYCTSCNNDKFFSYRKENATTNRHNAVLKLR